MYKYIIKTISIFCTKNTPNLIIKFAKSAKLYNFKTFYKTMQTNNFIIVQFLGLNSEVWGLTSGVDGPEPTGNSTVETQQ